MDSMEIGLKSWIIILLTIVLFFILSAQESSADTIIVAKDGSGDYEKIQDAIDNAGKGDTIRVLGGIVI